MNGAESCLFTPVGEQASGNIFMRKFRAQYAGQEIQGHTHNFDHTTIVFTGAVHVRGECPDGRIIEQDFHAPDSFLVKKDVKHTITAIEDNTEYWCVYSHREPETGEVVQEYNGWGDAYV